jgi:hypothetical protein
MAMAMVMSKKNAVGLNSEFYSFGIVKNIQTTISQIVYRSCMPEHNVHVMPFVRKNFVDYCRSRN